MDKIKKGKEGNENYIGKKFWANHVRLNKHQKVFNQMIAKTEDNVWMLSFFVRINFLHFFSPRKTSWLMLSAACSECKKNHIANVNGVNMWFTWFHQRRKVFVCMQKKKEYEKWWFSESSTCSILRRLLLRSSIYQTISNSIRDVVRNCWNCLVM